MNQGQEAAESARADDAGSLCPAGSVLGSFQLRAWSSGIVSRAPSKTPTVQEQ